MGLLYVPLICGTLMEQEAQPLEKLGQHHVLMVEGKYKKEDCTYCGASQTKPGQHWSRC